MKKNLTPRDRVKAAYLYIVEGLPQHVIAGIFEVNAGRVNEAIKAIQKAAADPRAVRDYKDRKLPRRALKKRTGR